MTLERVLTVLLIMGGQTANRGDSRVIRWQRAKDSVIVLSNGRGRLIEGDNEFCLRFEELESGRTIDVSDVRVNFMPSHGRIVPKPVVAQVTQTEAGRYCGRVRFGWNGIWVIDVKYRSRSGPRTKSFALVVKRH